VCIFLLSRQRARGRHFKKQPYAGRSALRPGIEIGIPTICLGSSLRASRGNSFAFAHSYLRWSYLPTYLSSTSTLSTREYQIVILILVHHRSGPATPLHGLPSAFQLSSRHLRLDPDLQTNQKRIISTYTLRDATIGRHPPLVATRRAISVD